MQQLISNLQSKELVSVCHFSHMVRLIFDISSACINQ